MSSTRGRGKTAPAKEERSLGVLTMQLLMRLSQPPGEFPLGLFQDEQDFSLSLSPSQQPNPHHRARHP